MHRLRLLFVFAAALAVTCASSVAHAQSITSSDPARTTAQSDPKRPDNQNPLGISYADCVADMTLQFAVQLSGFTGNASLQVWASLGSTCADRRRTAASSPAARRCAGALEPGLVDPSDQSPTTVNVRVQDLVGWQSTTRRSLRRRPGCRRRAPRPAPRSRATRLVPMAINFLAVDGSEQRGRHVSYQYTIQTDMVGPPAPVVCESVGDTVYNLTWAPNSDSDTVGYGDLHRPHPGPGARRGAGGDAGYHRRVPGR
jgi:hypothetical protein